MPHMRARAKMFECWRSRILMRPSLDFNPIIEYSPIRSVLRGASSRGVLRVEPDAAPARVLSAQHAPGRPGAPPGGHTSRLPGARLTDGRQGSPVNEKRGPGRKEEHRK